MRNAAMVIRTRFNTQRPPLAASAAGSPLTLHLVRSPHGFTFLEMLIVLFLLGGVLALVIPRIVVGEDLSSTGRKFIGTLRSLQSMAATIQKPVKLYLDLDRGTYWAMVV